MSKFFVTNNISWYDEIKKNIYESPFKISGDYEINGIYAITTKKLLVDNINSYKKDDDFIIHTGTCVYKEVSGENALKNAIEDFSGNVELHREEYMGNFGCFIKKDNNMVVFNEGAGFYNVFYYSKDGYWMVGTSLLDMAKVLKDVIILNKTNVLEELTRFAIFGNNTYFNEIQRLSGDQYLDITQTGIAVKFLDLRINQDDIFDYKSRVKNIAKEMKYIAKVMYKNFGKTTLGCTGGFDSRMTLAAYLSEGIKPKISYGYGNSVLAPSKMGDVEINREFSKRYSLELSLDRWDETQPIDKLWDYYICKYGGMIYDGCEDTLNYYTKKDEPFLSFGYIGELYREADWSKRINNESVSFSDYLWGFHADFNDNIIKNNKKLQDQWIRKWRNLNKEHGIEDEFFKKEDLFWITLDYRHSADNHMCNLINQFKYAHYLMSDLRIVRNSYVNFDIKYNGKFMIQILNEIFPDILSIPFFTHGHLVRYNSDLMQVEEYSSHNLRKSIRIFVRSLLPRTIKTSLKKFFNVGVSGSQFLDNVAIILQKDGNAEKLEKLLGTDTYSHLILDVNYNMIVRGIILCKTFDSIGIKY